MEMTRNKQVVLAIVAQKALKDLPEEQRHGVEISLLETIADASAPLSTVAEAVEKLTEMFPDARRRNETFVP